MYNESLKRKFLDYYTSTEAAKKRYETQFDLFQKYEDEFGGDLCTMPQEVVEPIFNKHLGLRAQSRSNRMSMFRAYSKWCTENGVANACDGILHVNADDIEKIKEMMVNSPLHLQKYLDVIFDSESKKTIDNAYRCYMWLAYGGCPEEEIVQITKDDVDLESMVVRSKHSGDSREYPIYREAIQAFKNCVSLNEFVYYHPNYSREIIRERVDGNQLLRGVKANARTKVMRVELSRRSKLAKDSGKTNIRLSYYRAWLSGVFYRAYQLEMVGVDQDFMETAGDFIEGKVYKLSSGRNLIGAKQRRVAREYKEDYERWKLAFFQ